MLFDYETMGMRSISVMSCMIWTRNSSHHTSHTPLPPIHHHCVINYQGLPTNAISLLLFSSFIVVIGAFCWGWISFLLRCCHGHCQIDYDLTGTAVSWLPLYSNGTREYSTRSMDQTTNPDSRSGWFDALCCLSFASAVEKRKYGVDFCCIFICRPDWWWSSFFRVGGLFLSFLHCSHISGGYLSFFFSCHLSRSCWCLHAGFVDRRFLVIFFSIYHLRRKGGRLISFTISFRFTRGVHVLLLFFTYLISNLGGCLINYLSVVFWFYVVNAFLFLLLFFALHSPSYFYLIWCVFQVMWVYEVLV